MAHSAGEVTSRGLLEHRIDHHGVRTDLHHRASIDREMTEMQRLSKAVRQNITFLFRHQAVHQTCDLGVARRHPGDTGRRQVLLQGLEQQHEIPHRKHVVFHEQPQVRDGRDRLRQRMTVQLHQFRVPAPSNPENHPDAGHPPR